MYRRIILFLWVLWLAGITGARALSVSDALVWRQQYEQGRIKADELLRKYDSLFLERRYRDSVAPVLDHYKMLVFSNPLWVEKQFDYYDYAAMAALAEGDLGKALFNNYKLVDLAICRRDPARILRAYQFQVLAYGSSGIDERTLEAYSRIKPVCDYAALNAPAFIDHMDNLGKVVLVYGGALVAFEADANVAGVKEVREMLHRIDQAAVASPQYLDPDHFRFRYFACLADCVYENIAGNAAAAHASLLRLKEIVEDTAIPPAKSHPLRLFSYYRLWHFHLDKGSADSASYYCNLYSDNGGTNMPDIYLPQYYNAVSRLEYKLGHHKEAEAILINGMKKMDTVIRHAMTVQSNNFITQIEAGMEREKLLKAEQKSSQLFYRMLVVALALVIILLVVLLVMMQQRSRQRKRLTRVKQEMARNLHDQVGPMLFYSKLLAEGALDKDESARKLDLHKLGTHLSGVMHMVRDLSHEMKSDKTYFTTDLEAQMLKVLNEYEGISGMAFGISSHADKAKLPLSTYNQLLAVLYELVNNTLKHSGADLIALDFTTGKGRLLITYTDNGSGFDPVKVPPAGIGLENIRERVSLLRGRFELGQSGKGFRAEITIPIQ